MNEGKRTLAVLKEGLYLFIKKRKTREKDTFCQTSLLIFLTKSSKLFDDRFLRRGPKVSEDIIHALNNPDEGIASPCTYVENIFFSPDEDTEGFFFS